MSPNHPVQDLGTDSQPLLLSELIGLSTRGRVGHENTVPWPRHRNRRSTPVTVINDENDALPVTIAGMMASSPAHRIATCIEAIPTDETADAKGERIERVNIIGVHPQHRPFPRREG